MDRDRKRQGFGAIDRDRAREIASTGGKAAHASGNAHEFDRKEAARAGKKGGRVTSEDRDHMAEIGRRGGLERARRRRAQQEQQRNEGNGST